MTAASRRASIAGTRRMQRDTPDHDPELTPHQRGLSKLQEYTLRESGDSATHMGIADDLADIAPDVGRYIVDFGYGEIYSRPGLTNQQRSLITIASLVTQGTEREIELHVNTGLTAGLTSTEIVESVIHLIPYTGFPRVLNALYVVKRVFEQRQVDTARPDAA
jgi:4-carboxymuconolactone decarboxylase